MARSKSTPPWLPGPSILSVLRSCPPAEVGGTCPLPDDEPEADNVLQFAPGALDGIATHHMGTPDENPAVATVDALAKLVRANTDAARTRLYRLYLETTLAPHADAVVEEIVRRQSFTREAVRPHARWLLQNAAHREPFKLGILLLGLSGTPEDLDDLRNAARHDEFTLFAAVAVGNLLGDPVDTWWEMARGVHGWGKVQLVGHLCRVVG